MRTDPFDKSGKMHQGLDFSAPRNIHTYAASNGTIVEQTAGLQVTENISELTMDMVTKQYMLI